MIKFLSWLVEFLMRRSKKPWARFTIDKIATDNQISFHMSWNKSFIKKINELGFFGESDEETIQNFLFSSLMYPKDLEEDEVVVSEYHPQLQNETNTLKR